MTSRSRSARPATAPSPSSDLLLPASTACSSDIPAASAESYCHIVEVLDHGPGRTGKSYIAILFSRYCSPSGEHEKRSMQWLGPFATRQEIESLFRGTAQPESTRAPAPTSTQTVL